MAAPACPLLVCKLLRFFFFFCVVLVSHDAVVVHGQSTDGFISIDCGIAEGSGYYDPAIKYNFSGDAPYVDAGESKNVLVNTTSLPAQYRTLRSFPNGTRNCYSLWPVKPGGKYLVRAGFWYGNYDGNNSIPVFDLHIGVNFWTTVDLTTPNGGGTWEVITVAKVDFIWVCLVNTGNGTPFISTLHLRPLPDTLYALADHTHSLVLQGDRRNYGTKAFFGYPDDPYDRFWFGSIEGFRELDSTWEVTAKVGDGFQVPPSVLETAATTGSLSIPMKLVGKLHCRPGDKVYAAMHFAELEQLMANETRKMDIYEGADRSGRLLYANYSPPYLQADARDITTLGEEGTLNISIYPSASSTQPPIINALEMFLLRPMVCLSTDHRDVNAIQDIKSVYKVKRNWMGDPCAPKEFVWDGVNCSYEASKPPRIIYLNLTSSGLSNGIAASIANLTALTNLDLSNNSLTGTIPDFLAELPSLKLLNLAGNNLTGMIPQNLCAKLQNVTLLLSIESNREQCSSVTKGKKKSNPKAIALSIIFPVLFLISILLWGIKRRKACASNNIWRRQPKKDFVRHTLKENDGLKCESHGLTFSDIKKITKNFETTIGKGGFGTVYLGYLNDKTKVAVKVLSQSSSQGTKEFQAEAIILTRVHHKSLVSLLGYCDDEQNLALVYEYMDQGNLHDHLSGKIENTNVLSWQQRVKIVLEAAQGLDYLHNGCKPPIIHRDVKSDNILLSHNFTTKLSDFGLSRAFDNENVTHITTGIAGTPGYLDPEYHETYRLNEKSDVYSFGIVLLEIITGQSPILNFPERTHIVKWVCSQMECGNLSNIVDSRLCGDYDTNSVQKVLEIAMACTSTNSTQRLTMSNVVAQLKECMMPKVTHDELNFDMPNLESTGTLNSEELS